MRTLREVPLTRASVPRTATFRDAADALCEARISAIAVLDEDEGVVGLFTDDDLVAGLVPGYLKELRHTAFAEDLDDILARRVTDVSSQAVTLHMRARVTVEADSSATHAAERFLHVPWGALAVVERGRFVGMLTEVELARSLLELAPRQ